MKKCCNRRWDDFDFDFRFRMKENSRPNLFIRCFSSKVASQHRRRLQAGNFHSLTALAAVLSVGTGFWNFCPIEVMIYVEFFFLFLFFVLSIGSFSFDRFCPSRIGSLHGSSRNRERWLTRKWNVNDETPTKESEKWCRLVSSDEAIITQSSLGWNPLPKFDWRHRMPLSRSSSARVITAIDRGPRF